jgi:hypothetical protein
MLRMDAGGERGARSVEYQTMSIETWVAFAAASAVLLVIPGPTILLVISYALGRGMRTALPVAVGVALGDFTDCETPGAEFTLRDIIAGLAGETGLPCVGGFPIGHGAVNVPVALGARVRLDGGAGTLTFLEPAVAD